MPPPSRGPRARSRARRARCAARRGRGGAARGSTARSCRAGRRSRRARARRGGGGRAPRAAPSGSVVERLAQRHRGLLGVAVVPALVELADLLAGDRAALAHVVDGDVARDAQDPGRERDLALLVLRQDRHQLGEDVLRDVLGLVVVAHDAAHVAVDVVGVADVEEADRLRSPSLARATACATMRRSRSSRRPGSGGCGSRPARRVVSSSSARARNALIMRVLPSMFVRWPSVPAQAATRCGGYRLVSSSPWT